MADIQSATAEIRRGKKKERRQKKKPQGKNIMVCPIPLGDHKNSGIRWTICKAFAPHSRQITTPVAHHAVFTGWMPFLPPNQQCQSTEG